MKCRSICRKQKLSVGDCLGEEYVEITERIDENFSLERRLNTRRKSKLLNRTAIIKSQDELHSIYL